MNREEKPKAEYIMLTKDLPCLRHAFDSERPQEEILQVLFLSGDWIEFTCTCFSTQAGSFSNGFPSLRREV
jgi:hypothetical protein